MRVEIFKLVCLALTSVSFAPAQDRSLDSVIANYSSSPALVHASWSVCARFVDTDSTICSFEPRKILAPASCLKLVTTAAALAVLGEEYRFQTTLTACGRIDSHHVLHGDLCIVGGGDPTLGSDLTPGSADLDTLLATWVRAIKQAGIRRIAGRVLADDFAFDRIPIPDDWFWVDIGNYYATSTSALTINDNLYRLYFHPGKKEGDAARLLRMEPRVTGLRFENHMKTGAEGSGDNGYIYCAPGEWNAVLRGTVPAGPSEFDIKGSLPDPPLFAAQALRSALRQARIPVQRGAIKLRSPRSYRDAKIILTTFSPPLKDVVTVINKRSFNLYAEQLLKTIGRERKGEGSTDAGIEAVEGILDSLGVDLQGMQLSDGCGLSRTNGISTWTLVSLLRAMKRTAHFDTYYHSLSLAGDSSDIGFFKSFGVGTEIQNNARIKSGTIQGVRSYSGYIRDRQGRLIAFALIANNFAGRSSRVDAIHRDIILQLARLP